MSNDEQAKNETRYDPEPFNLGRPAHLLAKDVVKRIENRLWDNGIKVSFGWQTYADVEQLIKQLRDAACRHTRRELEIILEDMTI